MFSLAFSSADTRYSFIHIRVHCLFLNKWMNTNSSHLAEQQLFTLKSDEGWILLFYNRRISNKVAKKKKRIVLIGYTG